MVSAKTRLFSPLTIKGVTIPNRAWVAPMCQYMADDGMPNDWHHVHLSAFANGGFGLILTEATAVCPEGRTTPHDTGLWNDEQRDAWARITQAVHARGSRIGVQLGHAGRKAGALNPFSGARGSVPLDEGGWSTVAPSPIAFGDYAVPSELTSDEISQIPAAFALAAQRAVAAGFDVVEVHAAHGYLLHQFLSPLSNARTDDYGGRLVNRACVLLQVVRAIRRAIPDVPLFVRLSATDWEENGLTVSEVAEVAGWLREEGVDFIDVSTGGNTPNPEIRVGPGYQVAAARAVREVCELPVSAVGLITTAEHAESILVQENADAIMLGRAALIDPHWPLHAAQRLQDERTKPLPPHRTTLQASSEALNRELFKIA